MNEYARDLWSRAKKALQAARRDAEHKDTDAAASRAYYAAFHAVSALLAVDDQTFSRHSAVEAALHRELVRTGRWSAALGADYRTLRTLRNTGDYGGLEHVTAAQAAEAVLTAERILDAVAESCPGLASTAD